MTGPHQASLAQRTERVTTDHEVEGSNPSGGAMIIGVLLSMIGSGLVVWYYVDPKAVKKWMKKIEKWRNS